MSLRELKARRTSLDTEVKNILADKANFTQESSDRCDQLFREMDALDREIRLAERSENGRRSDPHFDRELGDFNILRAIASPGSGLRPERRLRA